jgi:hypothetical protein
MTNRKTLAASAASLALAAVLATTPASADWHGGYGGRGHHGHRGWGGGAIAAGIIGGLALGALAVGGSRRAYAEPVYATDPVYDGPVCHRAARPVYDAWGRYVGERMVRICD